MLQREHQPPRGSTRKPGPRGNGGQGQGGVLAVEGALFSGFGTAGQRCTSLGTVWVHGSVHDDFVDAFARA